MKIFVQITSYRDPQLIPTIVDCIRKAKEPNNLSFGICWQHDEKEDLKEFIINPKFRIVDVPWTESRGAGWARSLTQNLYEGENYTLQIDSHHRFEKDWDEKLIKMIEGLKVEKPIISSLAGAYRSSNGEKLNTEPYKISITGFDEESLPILRPDFINNWEALENPIKGRFLCGHFLFARGEFCDEYKPDPEVYFEGYDISMSARCFTMGYDFFHPNKTVIWHEYTRSERSKHWIDHTQSLKEKGVIELSWKERDEKSKKRVKQLLGIEDSGVNLGSFGLGDKKTLREYEMYTGVDFNNKLLHQSAIKGEEPVSEVSEGEWSKGLTGQIEPEDLTEYSLEVSWSKEEIEQASDYSFWFFGFHDEDGKEIYRSDFNLERNKDILNFEKTSIEVSFKSKKEPKVCIIWPYSKSKGWLTKLETEL